MNYPQFTVRIPAGARTYSNGNVIIVTKPYPKNVRRMIGKSCDDGMMHPNSLYFKMFPQEWKEQYPDHAEMIHEDGLGVGMFALVLGIGTSTGIYPILVDTYGPLIANGIMDFVLYNIMSTFNTACNLPSFMKNQLLFSIMPHEDSWYSDLFNHKMNERTNNTIRKSWIKACIENGLTNVYLSIDGTNDDYVGKSNGLAKKGHNKTGTKKTIVSCIWVVCADGDHRGLPLTYFVTDGNVVDNKAVTKVFMFLKSFKLHIKGVLADRGFCSEDVFKFLYGEGIPFVIMMTENTKGYTDVMEKYKTTIKDNMSYSMEGGDKFGIVTNGKLLSSLKFESKILLIYDTMNGATQRHKFLKDIYKAKNDWNNAVQNNLKPSMPDTYKKYIHVSENSQHASLDRDEIQKVIDNKGYYVLGSSIQDSASNIDEIYNLRDSSEKVFEELKTSLGFDTLRGHYENGVLNRIFCAFIAIIIRNEILNSCKRHDLVTKNVITDASRISYSFLTSQYDYVRTLPLKLDAVFADFNLNDMSIRSIDDIVTIRFKAEEGIKWTQEKRCIYQVKRTGIKEISAKLNNRCKLDIGGDIDQYYNDNDHLSLKANTDEAEGEFESSLGKEEVINPTDSDINNNYNDLAEEKEENEHIKIRKKPGPKPKPKVEKPKGPGRGRKKGSKNKKTLEREQLIAAGVIVVPPKNSRGRPKSSETLARETQWRNIRELAKTKGVELPDRPPNGRPSKFVMELRKELLLSEGVNT